MRWLHNISFSSSSSSSSLRPKSLDEFSSSDDRDHHHKGGGLRIAETWLTRHRKVPHMSNQKSVAESTRLSRSTSNFSAASRSPTVAVPLPLPLPLPEGDVELRFPSPNETGHGKGLEVRDKEKDRADKAGDRGSLNSPVGGPFASRDAKKDMKSHKATPQDQIVVENAPDNYSVNVPARSAPNSPLSSPMLSPQSKRIDIFTHYNMGPRGNQAWSAPEMPTLRGNQAWSAPEMPTIDIPGLPPPAFFDYTAFSTENSPIHSPPNKSPSRHTRTVSGPSSPLHSKLFLDLSNTRRESSNVHPLPLPPGAALPSASTPVTPAPSKVEPFSMTSQWQKGKLIGRGTFGSVYVASNRETGALCAMKEVELFPDDPKSAECIKQLEQEIKVLSHLKHPNIVQYFGSEIIGDHFYIYLEYVHPGSISKFAREHYGAITESVVRSFTRHILSGLAYLHKTKTIHRDIKGANLLVDASGVVKLADFGMAKHLSGQRADLSLKGSPYWMAPELMQAVMQKDNSSDLAFAVDIWSLGCTIIEMLTGKPPWSEYEGAAAMFKVMKDTPTIPESLSSEGKDFLRCCFQRNPAERPTASMLLEHRFLKNSPQSDIPSLAQSNHGGKLMDKPASPNERLQSKLDQLPAIPSSKGTRKMMPESESGQRYHYETLDLTMASRYSPRSTLEGLHNSSPPQTSPSTKHPNQSATTMSCISFRANKNHSCR